MAVNRQFPTQDNNRVSLRDETSCSLRLIHARLKTRRDTSLLSFGTFNYRVHRWQRVPCMRCTGTPFHVIQRKMSTQPDREICHVNPGGLKEPFNREFHKFRRLNTPVPKQGQKHPRKTN